MLKAIPSFEPEATVIPRMMACKMVSLGYEQLLADLYWLSFVQYVGNGDARSKDRYALAENYLQAILGLDPHFLEAYYFAAFIIGGEENKPANAAKILDKGIEQNEGNWYLPFIAGVNQYLFAHDEKRTSFYYYLASKDPQAPVWLERQSLILKSRIPTLVKQLNVWNTVFESSSSGVVKQRARGELIEVCRKLCRFNSSDRLKSVAKAKLRQLHELPE